MPGRGTTIKHCVFCHAPLNIACKVCKFCKAEQPYKLRLKKKVEKFDLKSKVWLQSHKKNHTASHLEKLHVLGIRAVLFMSRPGRKPNTWVSENVLPRSQLTEASTACLRRMQSLFDIVIQGWTVRAPEVLQTRHPAAVEAEDPPPPPPPPSFTLEVCTTAGPVRICCGAGPPQINKL
ncbi:hypothetical protein AMEX_G12759 [Astyanax mexicanus]|uniref:Uncharacterized protein n=1 Tax=Astyanax mexicanus TaxID=7994 RepID=A0A8T2LRY8_ASTMX|nr:hypothetical protein AMEX_G12759 [Astyanax mexicanus]